MGVVVHEPGVAQEGEGEHVEGEATEGEVERGGAVGVVDLCGGALVAAGESEVEAPTGCLE